VLFIGTQFSILYTSMYSPAGAASQFCFVIISFKSKVADFCREGLLYHLVHEWAVNRGAVSNVIVPAHVCDV